MISKCSFFVFLKINEEIRKNFILLIRFISFSNFFLRLLKYLVNVNIFLSFYFQSRKMISSSWKLVSLILKNNWWRKWLRCKVMIIFFFGFEGYFCERSDEKIPVKFTFSRRIDEPNQKPIPIESSRCNSLWTYPMCFRILSKTEGAMSRRPTGPRFLVIELLVCSSIRCFWDNSSFSSLRWWTALPRQFLFGWISAKVDMQRILSSVTQIGFCYLCPSHLHPILFHTFFLF